jgi:protein-disulfide isomerase
VIEFFDYNCGYCKRFSRGSVEPLVAAGDVRIDLVQTPILGPGSRRMAEFAAAAQLQGRFAQAHAYLIEQHAPTKADADALRPMLIRTAGIDPAKFDRALSDGTAARVVEHNADLAKRGGVTGTPLIYANGRVFRGYVDLETLRSAL